MIWKKSDKLDICYDSPKKRAKEENKMSNSILVSGRVASEFNVSTSKDGKKYAHFSIAVNKSNDKNETRDASFFNVSVFDGRSVSDLERFAKKGTPIAVAGYLSSDEGKDGLTYYRVNANSVTLVPGGDDKAAGFFVGTVARLFPTGFSFALNYGSKENPKTVFMFASFSKKLLENIDTTIYQVGDLIAVNGYLSIYKTTKEDGKTFNNLGIVIAATPVIIKKKGQQPTQANQQPVQQQTYQPQAQMNMQQPYQQPQVQQMAQAYQPQVQTPVQQPVADQMSEAQFNAITGGDYYVNNFDITSDDLPF